MGASGALPPAGTTFGNTSAPRWGIGAKVPIRFPWFPPGPGAARGPNRYFQRSAPPCSAEQRPKAFSPRFCEIGGPKKEGQGSHAPKRGPRCAI